MTEKLLVEIRELTAALAKERDENARLREAMGKALIAIDPWLDMEHWEECEARTEADEDDIINNPGDFLEKCDCSVKLFHNMVQDFKQALSPPSSPQGDV